MSSSMRSTTRAAKIAAQERLAADAGTRRSHEDDSSSQDMSADMQAVMQAPAAVVMSTVVVTATRRPAAAAVQMMTASASSKACSRVVQGTAHLTPHAALTSAAVQHVVAHATYRGVRTTKYGAYKAQIRLPGRGGKLLYLGTFAHTPGGSAGL